MPKSTKENWKGYQHNELQKLFSYYDISKSVLQEIIDELKIDNSNINISTLLVKSKSLDIFYENYLQERINYVGAVIGRVELASKEPQLFKKVKKECFLFLKQANYQVKGLDQQISNLLAMPIYIERGFIDSKPTMIENTNFENNKDLFAEWFVFFKENTSFQKFYNTDLYPILNIDKKQNNRVQKAIKQQQKNDVFKLLMINFMLHNIFDINEKLQLHHLYQTRQERLKNDQIAKEEQLHNSNYIWNKLIDVSLYDNALIIKNVKLKDVGNFRKYETDSRVQKIITYNSNIEWKAFLPNDENVNKIYVIERQIDNYEKVRSEELLKEIQLIEKTIYEDAVTYDEKEKLKNGEYEKFKKYIQYGVLKKKQNNPTSFTKFDKIHFNGDAIFDQLSKFDKIEKDMYSLIYIRNKFAHNQLPILKFYNFCLLEYGNILEHEYYADYFFRIIKDIKKNYNLG